MDGWSVHGVCCATSAGVASVRGGNRGGCLIASLEFGGRNKVISWLLVTSRLLDSGFDSDVGKAFVDGSFPLPTDGGLLVCDASGALTVPVLDGGSLLDVEAGVLLNTGLYKAPAGTGGRLVGDLEVEAGLEGDALEARALTGEPASHSSKSVVLFLFL